jgi:hypothetical protein
VQGQNVTLVITSNVPIFQERPFVCLRDAFLQYSNITSACVNSGTNSWTVDLPVSKDLLAKVAIAVTDSAGNLATHILRYLPDDLYVDNRDPQYTEGQGTWVSTTNASWGTDARLMLLNSNDTAKVDWFLPISWTGRYRISMQVPSLTNGATNVAFSFIAGGTNILAVVCPAGIPTNQWTFLGSAVLDQTLTNYLEMVVSGTNQPQTYAMADVLRIVPAPDSSLPDVSAQDPIAISLTTSGFLLQFVGQSGIHYAIQRGTGLTSGWSTLQIALPFAAGVVEYEDEKPLIGGAFYRILAQ